MFLIVDIVQHCKSFESEFTYNFYGYFFDIVQFRIFILKYYLILMKLNC